MEHMLFWIVVLVAVVHLATQRAIGGRISRFSAKGEPPAVYLSRDPETAVPVDRLLFQISRWSLNILIMVGVLFVCAVLVLFLRWVF